MTANELTQRFGPIPPFWCTREANKPTWARSGKLELSFNVMAHSWGRHDRVGMEIIDSMRIQAKIDADLAGQDPNERLIQSLSLAFDPAPSGVLGRSFGWAQLISLSHMISLMRDPSDSFGWLKWQDKRREKPQELRKLIDKIRFASSMTLIAWLPEIFFHLDLMAFLGILSEKISEYFVARVRGRDQSRRNIVW